MIDRGETVTRKSFLRISSAGLIAIIAVSIGGLACAGDKTSKNGCADCPMRKRYDADPTALVSRIWKWHIQYCPGWESYLSSLPIGERKKIGERYR